MFREKLLYYGRPLYERKIVKPLSDLQSKLSKLSGFRSERKIMQPIRQGNLTLTWNLKCGCYQFSLPPRLACPGVKERLKNPKSICNFCYAFNGRSGQMETAKRLLRKNWRAVHAENLLGLFQQALARLPAKTRYFRWFGCGDICDALMFNTIQVLALQFPSIRFWCPHAKLGHRSQCLFAHQQSSHSAISNLYW